MITTIGSHIIGSGVADMAAAVAGAVDRVVSKPNKFLFILNQLHSLNMLFYDLNHFWAFLTTQVNELIYHELGWAMNHA